MSCERYESVRDYALDELNAAGRQAMETHLTGCEECARELQQLQLATAALRTLPDREIPQRIAFVSDKVFQPSPLARFFAGFWNSAARLGFASACLLAASITYSALHSPLEIRTAQVIPTAADNSKQVDEAVQKAVARVREEVREEVRKEDARNTQAALAQVEHKYDEKQRALMISVQENFEVMQKRLSSYTMLASADANRDASRVNGQ